MKYLLLNKDNVVGEFETDSTHIIDWKLSDRLPHYVQNFPKFIQDRKAPTNRENARQLFKFEKSGINGFLKTSHALSLNDTFWVQSEEEHLEWDRVSLYRNSFDKKIAKYAMDGWDCQAYNKKLILSPEYTTDGTFAKCWTRKMVKETGKSKVLLLKKNGISGREVASEYFASEFLDRIDIDHIDYRVVQRNNEICSCCELFTSEDIGFVSFNKLYPELRDLQSILADDRVDKQFISDMLAIDAVIMNEDRHTGNFGFLVDNDTYRVIHPAPLFDYNYSMLWGLSDKYIDNDCVNGTHRLDRYSNTFIEVAREVMTAQTKYKMQMLYGTKLKSPKGKLKQYSERASKLNTVLTNQLYQLLR